jgi:hypothetical protein
VRGVILLQMMLSVIFQLPSSDILTGIIALVAVLTMIGGVVHWLYRRRWKGVRSAQEQEAYLREQLRGASYAEGPLMGTVTSVDVSEASGLKYRIKKAAVADIAGTTEITMRFDRVPIPEDRLNHDPFTRLFEDPSQVGLVNAEHRWTRANPAQGCTLVRIRVFSMEYDAVGSWCAGLPKLIWRAYEMEQDMER